MNFAGADRALREALGEKGLSIKGASSRGNVVEVAGLAPGTSAADVEVSARLSFHYESPFLAFYHLHPAKWAARCKTCTNARL